jgi:cobalt-precorrin-6B (C15)-methyltransferase
MKLWPYTTSGIPDHLFNRLPGIPLTKRETRLLMLSALQLKADSVLWDIGAGTGTISVEAGLLCPQGQIFAVERDEEVAKLIRENCKRFEVTNVTVIEGSAPDCFSLLKLDPDRVCIAGVRGIRTILTQLLERLKLEGRIVATAANLESLYQISETFSDLHLRHVEVVQSAVNRLEQRGTSQTFAAIEPIFVLSGEKME